jgi:hypothetical protein
VSGFLSETLLAKPLRTLYFFAGFALLPPLTMVRRVLIDRRIRFLVVCVAVVVSGVLVETWLNPHYFAAITPAFYAVGLQMMRHLRVWRKPGGQPVGTTLVRMTVGVCLVMVALRPEAETIHLELPPCPAPRGLPHGTVLGNWDSRARAWKQCSTGCQASNWSSFAILHSTVHWMSGSTTTRILITLKLSGPGIWIRRVTRSFLTTARTARSGWCNRMHSRSPCPLTTCRREFMHSDNNPASIRSLKMDYPCISF